MKRVLQKHRRFFATGALLAFALAWVLPVQACFASASAAAVQIQCPNCPSPQTCDPGSCGASLTASCAAMVSAVTVPAHSPDKALPAPACVDLFTSQVEASESGYSPRTLVYLPSASVNIRFCSFLK